MRFLYLMFVSITLFAIVISYGGKEGMTQEGGNRKLIALPKIAKLDNKPLNKCLFDRKSVRSFTKEVLSLVEISELLWAAQGVTTGGHRTVPSADELYPVDAYLLVARGEELEKGFYQYLGSQHALRQISTKNLMPKLQKATSGQNWITQAPVVVVFVVTPSRTTKRYKERGERYVMMEVGNATQNVYLQSVALDLGTAIIGSFDDDQVRALLKLPEEQQVVALMPVGKVR